MWAKKVFRTAKCVLFIEVPSFQGVLIKGISLSILCVHTRTLCTVYWAIG